jgi:APA family basic amino acid/polyamine antiporter
LWCFFGWSDFVAVAGEVRRPERNLPFALIAGTGLILLLYGSVNYVFLKLISPAELATVSQPAALAAERLFGAGSKVVISLAVTAAAAGCVSAGLLLGPRVVYALAQDGLFPKAFGRVHPRFHTPSFAIVIQAIWTSLLCFSGRYDQLYTYAIFAVILAYAGTGAALLLFRRRFPNLPRPYRCWGYPIVPLLLVATSLALAANTIREQPQETLTGIGILLLGLPVYFWMRRRAGRSES